MHSREQVGFGADVTPAPDMPPGDHPLEVAARKGIGPLSPAGSSVWHGQCEPCVSCGQLVTRGSHECDSCGQDLSPQMRRKMGEAAGPWFVFEHVRPFPGISFERLVRQIRKGVVTATSIVRGPTTQYQWHFAGETPALARYLGICWHCGETVSPAETYCHACLTHMDGTPQAQPLTETAVAAMHLPPPETKPGVLRAVAAVGADGIGAASGARALTAPRVTEPVGRMSAAAPPAPQRPASPVRSAAVPSPEALTEELRALTAVLEEAENLGPEPVVDEPARIAGIRATWLIGIVFVILFGALIGVIKLRERQHSSAPPQTEPPAATRVLPAP
ncbi:MAG: zinc ribbon domain-containing protein [Phycisphaerales bacterium]|nr:zinc ribbon domain-containing protein [Phycisphaerales bacterium]